MLKHSSKELLYLALQKCLKTKEVDAISVKELTAMAGVSRQTFYKHFQDKFALINQFFYDLLVNTYEKIGEIHSLRDFFVQKYTLLWPYHTFMRAAIKSQDYNNLAAFTQRKSQEFYEKKYHALCQQEMPAEKKVLLNIYCTSMVYMLEQWLQKDIVSSPAEMADLLIAAMPQGLTATFAKIFPD